MKKIITYLFLFSYTTSVVMPVLPFVKDYVAHTFWLYEHISTTHLENGNYHTHYEADTIAKKTSSEKQNDTAKPFSFAQEHIVVNNTIEYTAPVFQIKKTSYKQLSLYIPFTTNSIEIPPPEC